MIVKKNFFLRYNIFEDQMEFSNETDIYFLKKSLNKKIYFKKLNKTYVCLDFNGDLSYFVLHIESDKVGVVTKEIVKFIEAKKAKTGYDEDKPADYRRQNDEHYLVAQNNLYKLPKKKKDFISFFKSNENAIKKYMKDNKLDYEKINDLKKIIVFNNGL